MACKPTYEGVRFDSLEDLRQYLTTQQNKESEGAIDFQVAQRINGAHGVLYKNAVVIRDGAEEGTTYHEAFHVVSKLILTESERTALYKEWLSYNKNKSNLTFNEIEEELAEDFREYVMSGGKFKYTNAPVKQSLFQKLWNAILKLLTTNPITIEEVFSKIENGAFANTKISKGTEAVFRKDVFQKSHPNDPDNVESITFFYDTMKSMDLQFFQTYRGAYGDFTSLFNKTENNSMVSNVYQQVLNNLMKEFKTREDKITNSKLTGEKLPYGTTDEAKALRFLINNYWAQVVPKHKANLKSYKIKAEDINDQDKIKEMLEVNGEGYAKEIIGQSEGHLKIAPESNASARIRLILGTIPEQKFDLSTGKYVDAKNTTGLSYSMDFGTVSAVLMNEISGVQNPTELAQALKKASVKMPGLSYLLSNDALSLNDFLNPDVPNTSIHDAKFLEVLDFTQLFYNTENNFVNDIILENGDRRVINMNKETQREKIKKEWSGNSIINSKSEEYGKYYTGRNYNKSKFLGMRLTPQAGVNLPKSYVKFLDILGIEISKPETYSAEDAALLRLKVNSILEGIQAPSTNTNRSIEANLFALDESTNAGQDLETILDLEYKYNLERTTQSHMNPSGESVYNYTKHSYITYVVDAINKSKSLDELYEKLPQLSDRNPFIRGSSFVLNYLFDENGQRVPGTYIKMNIAEAAIDGQSTSEKEFNKLTTPEKLAYVVSRFLNNEYNLLRPADKKTERFIEIGVKPVPSNQDSLSTAANIFKEYLKAELYSIKQYQLDSKDYIWNNFEKNLLKGIVLEIIREYNPDKKGSIFEEELDDILTKTDITDIDGTLNEFLLKNDDFITSALTRYFNDSTIKLYNSFIAANLIEEIADGTIAATGIHFIHPVTKEHIKSFENKQALLRYIQDFSINDKVMNMEQLKLFFGNPVHYKDVDTFFKRTGSGVGSSAMAIGGNFVNTEIVKRFPRFDALLENNEAPVHLHDTKLGTGKPILRTAILEDIPIAQEVQSMINSTVEAYKNIQEEDDGGSIISLDGYRELLIRMGKWTVGKNSHEELYQWEMQNYFKDILSPNVFKKVFGTEFKEFPQVKNPITGQYEVLRNKPHGIAFPSLKPLYFGPYAEATMPMGLYKTSFTILLPSMINMKDADGKVLFPNLKGTFEFMYNTKTSVLSFRSANKGITTKLNKKTKKANEYYDTNGNLSLNKLMGKALFQDTYTEHWGLQLETGFKSKHKVTSVTQMKVQTLSGLFDAGQAVIPELRPVVNDYINTLDTITQFRKEILLRELGITETEEGNYVVSDMVNLKKKLLTAALSRDMPQNIMESIQSLTQTMGVDGVLNRNKFGPILFALNDAVVIKPKVLGLAAYQNPPAFFDSNEQRKKDSKNRYASISLNFYTKDKQNIVHNMEVYLPDIYEGLNTKQLQEILREAIAARVPTQGLNSVESITIKAFLPSQVGDVIIMASAVVRKSGSDFDIDKMYIFTPNYTIDSQNRPVYISYPVDNLGNSLPLKEAGPILRKAYDKYIDEYGTYVANVFKNKLWRRYLSDNNKELVNLPEDYKKVISSYVKNTLIAASKAETFEEYTDFIRDRLQDAINTTTNQEIKDAIEIMADALTGEISMSDDMIDKAMTFSDYVIAAMENRNLALQKKIITNPQNYETLIKPLDADIFSSMADIIHKRTTGNDRGKANWRDLIDRIHLTNVSNRFLEGKDAVAITALASKFQVLSSIYGLYIENGYEVYNREAKGRVNRISKINLTHNRNSNGKISIGHKQTASYDEDISFLTAKEKEYLDKQDIPFLMSLWINAAVDAAKDPFMFDLNVNLETLNVMLYLTQAGVPAVELLYFMNQPIIKEFINEKNRWQNQLTSNFEVRVGKKTKSRYKTDDDIVEELEKKYGKIDYEATSKHSLRSLYEFTAKPTEILGDYLRYKDIANKLRSAIQGITYDTNSAGKSTTDLLLRLFNTNETLTDSTNINGKRVPVIGNYHRILSDNKDFGVTGFIKPFYEQNKALLKQYAPLFKISLGDAGLRNMIDYITTLYSSENLNYPTSRVEGILEKLTSAYMSYNAVSYNYNKNQEVVKSPENKVVQSIDRLMNPANNNETVAAKIHKIQSIFKEFDKIGNNEKTKENFKVRGISYGSKEYTYYRDMYIKHGTNEFLRTLVPILAQNSKSHYDHVIIRNKQYDTKVIDRYNTEWESLENSAFRELQALTDDLVKVNFLQSGITPSPTNFLKFMPEGKYTNIMESTHKQALLGVSNLIRFMAEFMIDNQNDSDIVSNKFARSPIPFHKKPQYKPGITSKQEADLLKTRGINPYAPVGAIYGQRELSDGKLQNVLINELFANVQFYKTFYEGMNISFLGRSETGFLEGLTQKLGILFPGFKESYEPSITALNARHDAVLKTVSKTDKGTEIFEITDEDIKKAEEIEKFCKGK